MRKSTEITPEKYLSNLISQEFDFPKSELKDLIPLLLLDEVKNQIITIHLANAVNELLEIYFPSKFDLEEYLINLYNFGTPERVARVKKTKQTYLTDLAWFAKNRSKGITSEEYEQVCADLPIFLKAMHNETAKRVLKNKTGKNVVLDGHDKIIQ